MDTIRILRILEYEGDREWAEEMLHTRGIKGERKMEKGIIREAIIGEVPVILKQKGDIS